ncbi:MAG: efflux RND transporter permease subunit [Candidatus Gracilibacteria bacterium]|nr:efflux RND transporter permease subunit [Candidatus Gracilibacteria bacterium]
MFEKYFKAYRPFLLVMMILLSGIGIFSFLNLSKEAMPEVNLPFFNITATYPGADAETIEKQVIQKIEEKISSVKNLYTFSSISSNNVGVINLEFERGTDKGTAYSDLKSAIDEAKSNMPSGVKDVLVTKTDPKDIPIYSFSVTGPFYPSTLYDKVKNIEDNLKKISGVDKVIIVGAYTSQVEVQFDYEKLKKYNLRLPTIIGLIGQNVSQNPIDKKTLNGNLYSFEVRTYSNEGASLDEKLKNFEEFLGNVSIINLNGNTLRLQDIASVNVTHPFYQRLSYINGENAIKFMVYKVPGSDILNVINGIKDYLKNNETWFKEKGVEAKEIYSQEIEISKTYNAFIDGFRDTSILIMIVATIFLGVRGAISIAITFPFVYLLTFFLLKSYGYTFNTIVSGALNLSLGIMVDNLIVIAQGFQDGIRKKMGKYDALFHSLKIYWKPLLIGNMVTIAVFFPLGFVLSGKIGEFIKFLPTTVTLTLVFSIVVAFLFLPLVLSYMKIVEPKKRNNKFSIEHFFSRFEGKFDSVYRKILKFPKFFIIFFYSLFLFVIFLFSKFGTVDFMPLTDKDNIYININYNTDVNIDKNQKLTSKIYEYVNEFFNKNHTGIVKNTELSLGVLYSMSPLDNTLYNTSFNPDLAEINVVLTGTEERDSKDNAVNIYPELKDFLDSKIEKDALLKNNLKDYSVFIQKNGLSSGKDITFNLSISGSVNENSELSILAGEYEKMLPKLKKINGTYGWSSSLEYTNGKIKVIYDLDKISQLNLSVSELNAFLYGINQKGTDSNYLTDFKGNGISITSLNDFGKDVIPVKGFINYDYDNGKNINFSDLMIPGTSIYFSDVVKEMNLNPQIKSFQHLDGDLVLKVEANKSPDLSLGTVQEKVNEIGKSFNGVKIIYGADIKDMTQSGKDLGLSFLVGFILMFAIFVFNFGNFKQSLTLMGTIPLFLTGALFFLIASGKAVSMMVGIGFFGLIGVGLAHIIYLVNRFNELLEHNEGLTSLDDILINSVKSRLEPVFLTTTITSLGLFVLAFSDDFWTAFALSFAGGLILGTTITLVFIPSALKILYSNYKVEKVVVKQ